MDERRIMKTSRAVFFVLPFLAVLPVIAAAAGAAPVIELKENWALRSSAGLAAGGEVISLPGTDLSGWVPARVPTTVLSALVKNKVYQDVYFADNFARIPKEPFQVPWWFRTEFDCLALPGRDRIELEFDGINYRANIWLNGTKIADTSQIFGAFRQFRLDVTEWIRPDGRNALAVEILPVEPGALTMGFVDWNPKAPDSNMGIWRPVRLRRTGDLAVHYPFVQTRLDLTTLKEARLTVSAEIENKAGEPREGVLEGRIGEIVFSQPVVLGPRETKKIVFSPEAYPQLVIRDPRIWWTHDLGTPELYGLDLKVNLGSQLLDSASTRFGIREISDDLNAEGHRGYILNGRKILIRGGGWSDDLLLDNPPERVRTQVEYARQMNLNALRVEGFWGSGPELYDFCDETGILVMAGWSCQWEWEDYFGKPVDEVYGGILSPEDIDTAARSWRDQVRWLRNHPSVFVWAMASDLVPKPEAEKAYRSILAEDDPTRPVLNSTGTKVSPVSGKSGVKMNGPYDYVPPIYWFTNKNEGGAFGFNTETGPGPQVPPLESLRKMIPADKLWPINDVWFFHCCRGEFNDLSRSNEAMDKRLGPAADLTDYLRKAQFLNYEGMRGMYEAFVARRPLATGIIQWMYNSAWPKLWWQLFDYYLLPNGAFFGARKACEPLHILFDQGTGEVIVTNNAARPTGLVQASVQVLGLDGVSRFVKEFRVDLGCDEKKSLLVLDPPANVKGAYFLDLRLRDEEGGLITDNFYALPVQPDVLDDSKALWYVTPIKEFADLTGLAALPQAAIDCREQRDSADGGMEITATLKNTSAAPAFMIEIMVVKEKSGEAVVPVFWDDNYLTLLPGETRTVRVRFDPARLDGEQAVLKIGGWNAVRAGR
jgi:exo-1,4-beta-D-glucosaminidase